MMSGCNNCGQTPAWVPTTTQPPWVQAPRFMGVTRHTAVAPSSGTTVYFSGCDCCSGGFTPVYYACYSCSGLPSTLYLHLDTLIGGSGPDPTTIAMNATSALPLIGGSTSGWFGILYYSGTGGNASYEADLYCAGVTSGPLSGSAAFGMFNAGAFSDFNYPNGTTVCLSGGGVASGTSGSAFSWFYGSGLILGGGTWQNATILRS